MMALQEENKMDANEITSNHRACQGLRAVSLGPLPGH